MTGGGKGPVEAATFAHPWDADLARNYLEDAGVEAWVEDPYRIAGGSGLVRLLVPADGGIDARRVLAGAPPPADAPPARAEAPPRRSAGGRGRRWVSALGAVRRGRSARRRDLGCGPTIPVGTHGGDRSDRLLAVPSVPPDRGHRRSVATDRRHPLTRPAAARAALGYPTLTRPPAPFP